MMKERMSYEIAHKYLDLARDLGLTCSVGGYSAVGTDGTLQWRCDVCGELFRCYWANHYRQHNEMDLLVHYAERNKP